MIFQRVLLLLFLISSKVSGQAPADEHQFQKEVIADQLEDPWTIVYGPDNHLWVTESKGYRVLRFDPADHSCDTMLNINNLRNFPRYDTIPDSLDAGKPWPQGGLMGMALHPDLLKGKPFVYLAYVYDFRGKSMAGKGRDPQDGGFYFLTKIVRYNYDSSNKKLTEPVTVADSLPGSNDHNGGRLLIAYVHTKPYLFYSIGDMGAGQFENGGRNNYAQDTTKYEGKILRFETEPLNTKQAASWIPADNPFNAGGGNAIWSVGHRNPQGLTRMTVKAIDQVYISEHGPFSDDEINLLEKGGNYGHPLVVGYADGNYNGLAAAVNKDDSLPGEWNTTYPTIRNEMNTAHGLARYKEPLKSFYATSNSVLLSVARQLRDGTGKDPEWSSLAPSGLTCYNADVIPGWKSSLLITSLKQGVIRRIKLDATGKKVLNEEQLFKAAARYRDIAVSSDGKSIFIVTDKSTITSGPTEKNPGKQDLHGAIIRYTYLPGGE